MASTTTRPVSGRMIPEITFKSVDFPEPLRPSSAQCSPAASWNEVMSRMSTFSPPGMVNDLRISLNARTGVVMV